MGYRPVRQLAGTGTLLRFFLRRDRLMMPLWVGVISLLVLSMNSLKSVYGTAAERADLARQMLTNSSLRATYGPVFDDFARRTHRLAHRRLRRSVRRDDEPARRRTAHPRGGGERRQELLFMAMVGRRAPLTAALLAALVANGVLALLIAGGLAGRAVPGRWPSGSATRGCRHGLRHHARRSSPSSPRARLAKGLTGGLLGAAFVLRAAGDSSTTTVPPC